MQRSYNAADWYWIAKSGKIYSSARNMMVYPYDFQFLAWSAINGKPSLWPADISGNQTSASLVQVLSFYGITNIPPSP